MALFFRGVADAPPALGEASGQTDAQLVRTAQADPRAFGPLYERYHDRIYRYCYTRLGGREAAEDVTAEVFLRALTHMHQFRPGSAFLAWLYTIARHEVADHYRRRRGTSSLDEDGEIEAQTARAAAVAGTGAGGHIERAALAIAMSQLADEQRAVLELQLSGWSGSEIAGALGKSVAAVKMVRYRAMERLQQLLKEREQ